MFYFNDAIKLFWINIKQMISSKLREKSVRAIIITKFQSFIRGNHFIQTWHTLIFGSSQCLGLPVGVPPRVGANGFSIAIGAEEAPWPAGPEKNAPASGSSRAESRMTRYFGWYCSTRPLKMLGPKKCA